MQFFHPVNLLLNRENPAPPGISSNPAGSLIKGPDFEYFLNRQIDNRLNRAEDDQNRNNKLPDYDKKYSLYDSPVDIDEYKNTEIKDSNANDEKRNTVKSDDEAVKQPVQTKDGNSENKTERRDRIAVRDSDTEDKIENKNIHPVIDLSVLLKDILSLLKGNSLNKDQLKEVKSVISGIREQLLFRKDELLQNKELAALLNKLKNIINSANKNRNPHVVKQQKIAEMPDLKRKLSKLINELRQHLEKIAENPDNKIIARNKGNGNFNNDLPGQKIPAGASDAEIKDISHKKDNSSNQNFNFIKKEIAGESVFAKPKIQANPNKSGFNEQLNKIVQNAKIFIKDSNNGSFTIRLHPESLGRVNVNLNLEHGVIIGKFLVENSDAKEALIENMAAIRERLQENGIAVGEFQVNVRDQNNSASNFREGQYSYTDTLKYNIPANNQYELNSYYLHDGEIDLVI